jgi:hypothetical protein
VTPTTEQNKEMGTRAAGVISVLAGVWLFLSPWVYQAYSSRDAWNGWIVGAAIAILAGIRLGSSVPMPSLSWINCLLGIWAFVSPWVYGYTTNQARFINSLCVGVIVFVSALRNDMGPSHTQHPLPRM